MSHITSLPQLAVFGKVPFFEQNKLPSFKNTTPIIHATSDDEQIVFITVDGSVEVFDKDGSRVIQLPEKVEYVITKTEPAVKGNTTNNTTKEAIIETGLMVRVPLFIEEGETIIVTTEDGKYYSRA